MRFLKHPTLKEKNPTIPWKQEIFSALYRDIPGSTCPNTAVTDAKNVLLFGSRWRVRPGTEGIGSHLPTLVGRRNYEATKTGYVITATFGSAFTSADVGRFFVWPDGEQELIIKFVSATQIQVHTNILHSACTTLSPGKVRGRLNQDWDYKKQKWIFIHIDSRVFWTDYDMSSWREVINKSENSPAEEKSTFREYKNCLYLLTTNGLFKIDPTSYVAGSRPIEMFQINTEIPDNNISVDEAFEPILGLTSAPTQFSNDYDVHHKYGRKYVYSLAKIRGNQLDDRNSGFIQKETGTNKYPAADNFRDWRWGWRGTEFQNETGYLTGVKTLTPAWRLDEWQLCVQGSFIINYGTSVNIVCDFSDCTTWDEIAERTQERIRKTLPEAYVGIIFRYDPVNRIFIILPGDNSYSIATAGAGTATQLDLAFGLVGTNLFQIDGFNFSAPMYVETGTILGGTGDSGCPSMALQIPAGQRGWTHYPIYSTLSHDNEKDLLDDERFIWQKDVPVASALIVDINVTGPGEVNAIHGTFNEYDLGSILRTEGGVEMQIIRILSAVDVYTDYLGIAINNVAVAIGGGDVMTAYSIDDHVYRLSGDFFSTADVGETLYWSDGTYSTITEVVSVNEVIVAEHDPDHGTIVDPFALTWKPVERNYCDYINDTNLGYRVKDFALKQRLWDALPSGNLGTIVPGFLVTAIKEDSDFYFSQLPKDLEYLCGHYAPDCQKNFIKDVIRGLEDFPDQLIIFGAKSTWRCQTNVLETMDEPRIGESVAILAGLGMVDGSIGILDNTGIVTMGHGLQAVITSEPGIRLFDGYKYSEDKSLDQDGRGFIKGDLQQLRECFAMAYEPNLYGLMIWGVETTKYNGVTIGKDDIVIMDKCWRLALKPEQGYGFSELYGDDWIYPESGLNVLNIETATGVPITVMFDAFTGQAWIHRVRKGPADSGVNLVYLDKYEGVYVPGSEIPWIIKLKELIGSEERFICEFMEAHNHFRPEDEANQGVSGYDSGGFRNEQKISVKAFINGSLTELSETKDIPQNGIIVFSKPVKARRFQLQIEGTASEIQGVSSAVLYTQLVSRDEPSLTKHQENVTQEKMATPQFRLSKGRYMGMNIAAMRNPDSGSLATSCVTGEGPDGETSAFQTGYAPDLSMTFDDVISLPGDFTIFFGMKALDNPATNVRLCVSLGGAQIWSAFGSTIQFLDGANIYGINNLDELSYSDHWNLYALVRKDDRLILCQNGVKAGETLLSSIENISGDLVVDGDGVQYSPYLFDIIVYDEAFEVEDMEYYNRDVRDQQGFSLLPDG